MFFLAEIKFEVKTLHYCYWSAKSTHKSTRRYFNWATALTHICVGQCALTLLFVWVYHDPHIFFLICSWKTPQYQLHISRLLLWEIRALLLGYCWCCWLQILCCSNRIFWWKCFLSMWAANLKIKQGAKWKSSDNISCNFVWKLWVFRRQTDENKQYLLLLK